MERTQSAEDYLESILILSKELPVVRAVDICAHLGFKKSSVSIALKNLRENGMVSVNNSGFITLTEQGLAVASEVFERHEVLSQILIQLGVSKETALEDACRMEHVISQESFDAIKAHIRKTNSENA